MGASTRRHVTATLVAGLMLTASSCGGGDTQQTTPKPTPELPSTSTTAPTSSERVSNWQSKFTEAELDRYEEALDRWQEYSEELNAIHMKGKDTPEARATLKEYSMQYQSEIAQLVQTFERGNVRLVNPVKPVWWKAVSIKPRVVVISQCSDYRNLLLTQNGKEVPGTKPKHLVTPLKIEMDKPKGHDWMVATTKLKDKRSCKA